MSHPPLLLALALTLSGIASAATPEASDKIVVRGELRGSECLDPQQARGWTHLENGQVLVDAGRYKYRMDLLTTCSALHFTPAIAFRGDPIGGRVCGTFNDAIITRDYPCRIERMELLSKEQYQAALKDNSAARKAKKAARAAAKSKAT